MKKILICALAMVIPVALILGAEKEVAQQIYPRQSISISPKN